MVWTGIFRLRDSHLGLIDLTRTKSEFLPRKSGLHSHPSSSPISFSGECPKTNWGRMAPDSIRPLSLHQLGRRSRLRSTLTDNISLSRPAQERLTQTKLYEFFDRSLFLPFKSLAEKTRPSSKPVQSIKSLPMPDRGSICGTQGR